MPQHAAPGQDAPQAVGLGAPADAARERGVPAVEVLAAPQGVAPGGPASAERDAPQDVRLALLPERDAPQDARLALLLPVPGAAPAPCVKQVRQPDGLRGLP